ncbi:homocitrate synthase [Candidatus Galacturonibacter soehngenii]|uniref:Homocitrate synthase n=1 Tax=Candidatus Galacturonatibacter soehngenii TaxID=2307010 RepID=A0A7V7QKZ6_9FIRM|nr:homocitrate synthase [Candidatus Galacturonibacter soehngenii]KAB1438181.1 homocitrate synthase [Candidatus Galacturonibacter soehngenii]MBA4687218.1 homocitrate synthase [Candidatus Galacturonibacter soehngenii]
MKEMKHIVDTTLRDGEQSPGIVLRTEDKVKIAKFLDELGVYEIEAGVPCLGAIEEESICKIKENTKQAKISVWSRMRPEDIKKSLVCQPDIIHIGTPVSYIQIYSKLKKNKVWVQKQILECVAIAKSNNVDITVGLEDASRSDIGFVLSLIKELSREGVNTIRLADTVGILTPNRTKEIVETIKENSDVKIEMHVHNDLGMAVANSIIGAKAGADFIDITLFGIGERTGNCNFYDFIKASDSIFEFAMTKKQIREVEKQVYEELRGAM